jgi:hypothetical protein
MAALISDPSITSKRVVYVGSLEDTASVSLVRAAMIPFGNIKSVDIVSPHLLLLLSLSIYITDHPLFALLSTYTIWLHLQQKRAATACEFLLT